MKIKLSNEDICNSYMLWQEYIDPDGIDSEEDFNRMTLDQKLEIIEAMNFFEEDDGD